MKTRLIALLALWLLPLTAGAQTAAPLAEAAGTIQELDFASSSLLIDGMSYRIAGDAKVEIGGSFGAFTMLAPGMRVYYEFERHSPTLRIVRLIRELPRDVALDQS